MSEHISHVLQAQVSKVSTTLEKLIKTNQLIWYKLSKQQYVKLEDGGNVKTVKELLINLQTSEKRDEDRSRTLAALEEKVNKLCEKVDNLSRPLQNHYSAEHMRNRIRTTCSQPVEPGQVRSRNFSNCDSGISSEKSIEIVHINPRNDTTQDQNVRSKSESENGPITGNFARSDFLKDISVHQLSQTEQILKENIKKDIIGFKFKETERSIDNRVRAVYREECVPGELTKDTRSKCETTFTTNTPTENNLTTRNEVPSVQNLGTKPKRRRRFEFKQQQQPRSKSDFKTLAGLMRDPDEVPRIRDLNTWRHIAEEEKNRGLIYETSKDDETVLDTCLLLDISGSMQGDNFDEMIRMAKQYVKGIEEIAKALPVFAENIGIATFGHYIGVVQHMTNDYKKIQDILDMLTPAGSSPMSAGLYMGLACCLGNKCSKIPNLDTFNPKGSLGAPSMFSKMIMFTDGKATSDVAIQSDADNPPSNATEKLMINMALEETSRDIGRRDFRVYCYAIGCESDIHLKTITENTGGIIYTGNDIHKLIRMTQSANMAMSIKDYIPDLENLDDTAIKDVCQALYVGQMVSTCDLDEVIHLTKFFRNKTKGSPSIDEHHYLETSNTSLPPLGTRVRRGPDWRWNYQDSGGPGTIVGHAQGQVWVEWDNGHINIYTFSPMFGFGVKTVQEPRILRADELIAVGCFVQRGADWRFNDQDGGEGNVGVVIKVDRNATVVVRWPNKQKAVYKYGNDGFFEIRICDPAKVFGTPGKMKIHVSDSGQSVSVGTIQPSTFVELPVTSPPESKQSENPSSTTNIDETEFRRTKKGAVTLDVSWSYKRDETWYVYPNNVNIKIEKAFQRNSQLCIVEVHGEIFQISFKKMVQVCSKTGHVTHVRRTDKNEKTETDDSSYFQRTEH